MTRQARAEGPGSGPQVGPGELERGEEHLTTDIERLARDQITAHIGRRFVGHDLARLVAAVLEAEGYVTKLSPPGPDAGVDVLAARGPLGFERPHLCVQVKSSTSPVDVGVFRALQGTMATLKADQGLLVAGAASRSPSRGEAGLSFFSVRLQDADALVGALFKVYDRLPAELQAELPLKRMWGLVLEEGEDV